LLTFEFENSSRFARRESAGIESNNGEKPRHDLGKTLAKLDRLYYFRIAVAALQHHQVYPEFQIGRQIGFYCPLQE
jgi:hypothetical protein